MNGEELGRQFAQQLVADERPLRETILNETVTLVERALETRHIPVREIDFGRPGKSDEQRKLRRISDFALRYFGAQFFVLQRIEQSSASMQS
jgi:hypothetical protein